MRCEPMILVRDVPASASWYTSFLGCSNDHGRTDFDRIVHEGRVLLMLHQMDAEEHGFSQLREVVGEGFLLWIFVPDADLMYQRALDLNIPILRNPHYNSQAGWKEFTVQDPDGYRLAIAQKCGGG